MDLSSRILSDITVFTKYSRFQPSLGRRETWEELCRRNMDMHIKKYPALEKEIRDVYDRFVITKKVLPSMRSLQFAGKPIEISPSRIFNCAYLPIDHQLAFSEIMFLLLGGTGVGYSVQDHHIQQLPPVRKPIRQRRYLIGDSIEGWAEAVRMLVNAYMGDKPMPRFDFSDIREKGSPLITSGGRAPGPQPLKDCLHNLQKIFDRVPDGAQLSSLQVHDMVCYIADAVLAGGIRRAALIAFFAIDDEEMLTCKFGNWWELNPQRARANNSAVVVRNKVKEEDFWNLWEKIRLSGSGEPGIYFTHNKDWLSNPCAEISLKPHNFCNLCEINAHDLESQEDLEDRARAAAFIGTLQAGYTDFHYLRDIWRRTSEKEALIGISMTGIASGAVLGLDETKAAKIILDENARVAALIGIRKAARSTCVKPAGSTSCVLGSSSGIHAWHDEYFIRRLRLGKNESICRYLQKFHPELLEDDFFKPTLQSVLSLPMRAPQGAILRHESPLDLLERIKRFSERWIKPGHRSGDNTHNVSATISVREHEWKMVGRWCWDNRDCYNGLSFLPYDDHSYVQAPFETCTKEKYEEMMSHLRGIDLTKVLEDGDYTNLSGELACAGGACEIK